MPAALSSSSPTAVDTFTTSTLIRVSYGPPRRPASQTLHEYSSSASGTPKPKRDRDSATIEKNGDEDAAALRKQIATLEAENKRLRDQITALAGREARPSRTAEDSVREQQHNFFKYGNV